MSTRSMKISILVPFELIFDIDFGLIKLIKEEYASDIFDANALNSSDDTIKRLLVSRKKYNPLSILSNNEDIDEYYSQFIEREYDSILSKSIITGIGLYCASISKLDDFEVTIKYSDDRELEMFSSKSFDKFNFIHSNEVNCRDYDCIFVKKLPDLLEYRNFNWICIYLARYAFNTVIVDGKETIDAEFAKIISSTNDCKILDVYKNISIYDMEEQNGRQNL